MGVEALFCGRCRPGPGCRYVATATETRAVAESPLDGSFALLDVTPVTSNEDFPRNGDQLANRDSGGSMVHLGRRDHKSRGFGDRAVDLLHSRRTTIAQVRAFRPLALAIRRPLPLDGCHSTSSAHSRRQR